MRSGVIPSRHLAFGGLFGERGSSQTPHSAAKDVHTSATTIVSAVNLVITPLLWVECPTILVLLHDIGPLSFETHRFLGPLFIEIRGLGRAVVEGQRQDLHCMACLWSEQ